VARLGPWPSDGRLRASDADRDRVAGELTRHCAEGRLTPEELSDRLDVVLRARTLSELRAVTRDLPQPARPAAEARRRWRRTILLGGALSATVLAALGAGFVVLLSEDPLAAVLAAVVLFAIVVAVVAALGSLLVALAPFVAIVLAVRWVGHRLGEALEAGPTRRQLGA
jgi:hypothetical protein